jgi:protein TonB
MPLALRRSHDPPASASPSRVDRPRPRLVRAATDGEVLFTDLLASAPKARRPRVALAVSGVVHLVLVIAVILVPILWPAAIPESQRDYVRALLYDPPPPPPPPLPKGSALRPAARAAAPTARAPRPSPSAFTAPVEARPVPDEPPVAADASGSEAWGSETGSEAGVPEGMEGGVEGGVVGGVLGGVPGGVLGGTGTGDIPVVRDYDRPPRPIRMTRPVYPREAFVKKVEGTVLVEILIDADGRVRRARILESVPLLDAAALETVRQWSFAPAIRQGRAVATIAQAPITFRIY